MIYGIGTTYGGTEEMFPDFVVRNMVCIGWPKDESPGLHQMFARITVGDLIYAKSFPPRQGLYIKGVGVITSPKLWEIPDENGDVFEVGRSVRWLWSADSTQDYVSLGRIDDRYDYFRGGTLYEELGPIVQAKVIEILVDGSPSDN